MDDILSRLGYRTTRRPRVAFAGSPPPLMADPNLTAQPFARGGAVEEQDMPRNPPHHGFALMIGISPYASEHGEAEDHLDRERGDTCNAGRKVSKQEANYRPMEACGCCAMFQAPNRCSKVAGGNQRR